MEGYFLCDQGNRGVVFDSRSALGEDDAQLDAGVGYPLGHLRAFEKWHFEHVRVALFEFAEKLLQAGVPADAKAVVPSAKYRVARFELEVSFAQAISEAAGGDVADVVDEVRVQGADFEGYVEGFEGACWGVVVLCCGPGYSGEMFGELGALVCEPVAFFRREVATPVAYFNVSF